MIKAIKRAIYHREIEALLEERENLSAAIMRATKNHKRRSYMVRRQRAVTHRLMQLGV